MEGSSAPISSHAQCGKIHRHAARSTKHGFFRDRCKRPYRFDCLNWFCHQGNTAQILQVPGHHFSIVAFAERLVSRSRTGRCPRDRLQLCLLALWEGRSGAMLATDRRLLFLGQYRVLRRFVRRLVSTEDEVDELLQDLALTVLEHPRGPTDAQSFPFWCRGVARHLAQHRRRAFARLIARTESLGAIDQVAPTEDPERAAIAHQLLSARLGVLDDESRALLLEHLINQVTPSELASRWNVSPASMRMRLMRLRRALRNVVEVGGPSSSERGNPES